MKKTIKGIDASPGIAIGKVYLYKEQEIFIDTSKTFTPEVEEKRLLDGREMTKTQLEAVREETRRKLGDEKAAIFDGHITLLEDEDLFDEVVERIEDEKFSAEHALKQGIEEYQEMLNNLDDEYLRERAADLEDIAKRWLSNIAGVEIPNLSNLEKGTVIVARDLTPSDTAQINPENVLGFVTEIGGKTAHSSIMARSLEVPAVVGTGDACSQVETGDAIVVDAFTGDIIINPSSEELTEYENKRIAFLKEKEELKKLKDLDAVTKDGVEVGAWANIGSPNDLPGVLRNGAKGIGLYRTEFLFMEKDRFPTEDEQFEAYKSVAEGLKGMPVTIRTMDIGGDKALPYMKLPHEENPFLGWRALRVCLDRPEILKTQFKAILRASSYGKIKIMLPMIISISEVRKAREILEECKNELRASGITFDESIEFGIMVETPSVALRADIFAKEVDFFSIGTNDLTQYTLAVDRGNENISALYDTYNPGVIQAIKLAIDGAHANGIKISMCGEFAGDKFAAPLLLGLGLDNFSMSASLVPQIKKELMNLNKKDCEKLVEDILRLDSAEEVKEKIKKFMS